MTQMYSQKLKQQRDRLQCEHPNKFRAIDIKSEMDELMKDKSLPEDAKSNRYSDLPSTFDGNKEKILKMK